MYFSLSPQHYSELLCLLGFCDIEKQKINVYVYVSDKSFGLSGVDLCVLQNLLLEGDDLIDPQVICRFVRDHSLIAHFYRPTAVGAGFYSARLRESNTGRAEPCPYARLEKLQKMKITGLTKFMVVRKWILICTRLLI